MITYCFKSNNSADKVIFKKTVLGMALMVATVVFAKSKPVVQFLVTGRTIAMKIDSVKPAKASILLMLLLQNGVTSPADLQAAFNK